MKKLSEIKGSNLFLSTHITQGGLLYIPMMIEHPLVSIYHIFGKDHEYLTLCDNPYEAYEYQEYIYFGKRYVQELFVNNPKTSRPILMEDCTPFYPSAKSAWRWLLPKGGNHGTDVK